MKNVIKGYGVKIAGVAVGLSALAMGFAAHAAADTELVTYAEAWTASMKEDTLAVLGLIFPVAIIIGISWMALRKGLRAVGAGSR